jgi:hypothetical protein
MDAAEPTEERTAAPAARGAVAVGIPARSPGHGANETHSQEIQGADWFPGTVTETAPWAGFPASSTHATANV